MNVIPLTTVDLTIAAGLIVLLAGLSLLLRLGIARSLFIAAVRTALQLTLVGLVLEWVFRAENLLWVLLMAVLMLSVAGFEVMRRQQRRFRGFWGYGLGALSMLLSSFIITFFALRCIISIEPWYAPQYAIPLLGMLLGNTMNGIALGLERLTENAWERRAVIEARLALGESAREVMLPAMRSAVRAALIPIINTMSIVGLVSLPGMMTGQILSGSPPAEAVKYQILIMFLIAAGTGFGSLAAVSAGARRLFDGRQRLRLDRLKTTA